MIGSNRLYHHLNSSRNEGVEESIAMEMIQTFHALVVQFTQDLVRRTANWTKNWTLLCLRTPGFEVSETVSGTGAFWRRTVEHAHAL